MTAVATTQSEPPFGLTQIALLAVLCVRAVKRMHGPAPAPGVAR